MQYLDISIQMMNITLNGLYVFLSVRDGGVENEKILQTLLHIRLICSQRTLLLLDFTLDLTALIL